MRLVSFLLPFPPSPGHVLSSPIGAPSPAPLLDPLSSERGLRVAEKSLVVIMITENGKRRRETRLLPRGSSIRRARKERDISARKGGICSQCCLRSDDAYGEANPIVRSSWPAKPCTIDRADQGTDNREEQKRNSSDLESDWSNEKFSRRFIRKLAGLVLAEEKKAFADRGLTRDVEISIKLFDLLVLMFSCHQGRVGTKSYCFGQGMADDQKHFEQVA